MFFVAYFFALFALTANQQPQVTTTTERDFVELFYKHDYNDAQGRTKPREYNLWEFNDQFFNQWTFDVLPLNKYDYKKDNSCDVCPRIYIPICADDNKTYTNECRMACLNVLRKRVPEVKMIRRGPCVVFPM